MTATEDQNYLKYALIGTGALVTAGLVYYAVSNKPESNTECLREVDQLGSVKRDTNGMLSFSYYRDIFIIISKYAK